MNAIVSLDNGCVRLAGRRVLEGLTWTLSRGERWAVLGGNGAGKSTFLRLVRGEIWPERPGSTARLYHLDGVRTSPIGAKERMALVSADLQQLYVRNEWDIDGETIVLTGLYNTPLLYRQPSAADLDRVAQVMGLLGLDFLRRRTALSMSQGELRRVLMARALVGDPLALLLDEVCDGLDEDARAKVLETVDRLASADNPVALLHATHRPEEIPDSVDRGLCLGREAAGRSASDGQGDDCGPSTILFRGTAREAAKCMFSARAGVCPVPARTGAPPALPTVPRAALPTAPLIEIRNADVFLERRRVLHDVNWTVRPGERWAVLGANGSGKSTLCGLVLGDLRPALGGVVRHFGVEGGELAAVQRRIGYVSAALQASYDYPVTGEELVLSGFFASIGLYPLVDEVTDAQREAARRWLAHFGLSDLAGRSIDAVSYGQMRRLLLARAVVHEPELLVLDEPCSGLDAPSREQFLRTLSGLARSSTALVYVTHHSDELIPEIDRVLHVRDGRVEVRRGR